MIYSIKAFGGTAPRIEPRLLQDTNAQIARNAKLRSGALRPFFAPTILKELSNPATTYRSLYLHEHTSEDIFLSFENDVDIVKGPIANDEYNRTYITGLDVPRVFDNTTVSSSDTTVDSSNSYTLGLPSSNVAASLATDGAGTGELVSRAYVYTYIREWSDSKFDEGQPSVPAQDSSGNLYIDINVGDTVTISGIEDAPNASSNNVSRIAIYRVATSSTDAQYQLVVDFDIAAGKAGTVSGVTWDAGTSTFSYADSLSDAELGEVLKSTTWAPPEDNLKGIISLNNGVLVAFVDNVVHVSEPYQPHAWPTEYQIVLDHPIIGLGAFGNTAVALTDKYPILLNIQKPTLVIPQPTHSSSPCVSKNGIVSYENNVYFPSPSGLMIINTSGIKNITQELATQEEWKQFAPSTFNASIQDGRYFAYYNNTTNNDSGFVVLDLTEALAGLSTVTFATKALYVDRRTDKMYFIAHTDSQGWYIGEWEGLTDSTQTMVWKSKIFLSSEGNRNLVGARVRAEFLSPAQVAKINQQLADMIQANFGLVKGSVNVYPYNVLTFNGDNFESIYASLRLVPRLIFRYYSNKELILQKEITTSNPFKLPAGCVGTSFEVEVESNIPVYQIDVATSMPELR